MPFIIKDDEKEEKLKEEIRFFEDEKIDDQYIRQIVAKQKGKLNTKSGYYKDDIAEGNWSVIEKDSDIKDFDSEEIDDKLVDTCITKLGKSIREKDAEYTYVFIPSYYAVKKLILYYLRNAIQAKKIYGLKNAVVRRGGKKNDKFYGGLPFILRYMKTIYTRESSKDDHIKYDFAEIMQELVDRKIGLEINNTYDEFINDVIDCINNSHCKSYILDKRIKDFKDAKEEYYCIDYKEKCKNSDNLLIHNTLVNDYRILMHKDVEKDWNHIKQYLKKANEIINNTPNFPDNIPPKNDILHGDLKGWISQRVSHKDRVVYRKESKERTIYIATVCDHYKDAARRSKSTKSYR